MTDIEKLRVLLPHWMEHNKEHASEFRTWAQRAGEAGKDHVAEHIKAAAEKMEAANLDLEVAIEHLGGAADASVHDHTHHHYHHPH